MSWDLSGRGCVVTGAGSGIGRAVAHALAERGGQVLLADVSLRNAAAVADEIAAAGGTATPWPADVTEPGQVAATIAEAERRFGGLDVLVNNAGGATEPFYPAGDAAHWDHAMKLILGATMHGIHRAVPAMRRRGGGAIVNMGSVAALEFGPDDSPEYAAAKAAVVRLSAALATLRDSDGIRVGCVCPGIVDTPAWRATRATLPPDVLARLPARVLAPETIADAVVRLVVDETLAGSVLVCRTSSPPRLLDPGLRL